MAYTGTGTEQDPYLVSTWEDFKTCVAMMGAFIKVVDDIDAFEESGMHETMVISADKIYADSEKTISNIRIETKYAFNTPTKNCLVVNIFFKDLTHVATDNTFNYLFYSNTNNVGFRFTNCKFSILVTPLVSSGTSYFFDYAADFDKCAIYVSFQDDVVLNYVAFDTGPYSAWTSCVCEIVNLKVISRIYFDSNVSYSTIKIDCDKSGNDAFKLIDSGIYNIIAAKFTGSGANVQCEIGSNRTAVDTEYADPANIFVPYPNSNVLYLLTTAQIQSESYLREIGFIP